MNQSGNNQSGLLLALKLARRELRGGIKGFRILLACLALGVAAIASVQTLADGILDGLRSDGRIILGGDIALRVLYREITPEQRDFLLGNDAELSHFVEMRTMARQPENDQSTLVELKAVEPSYPLYGDMTLAEQTPFAGSLAQQDGRWGALIDPALPERLDVMVGDALQIGEQVYTIRGIIEREPDRAGGVGGFGFWPRVMVSQASLPDTKLLREGSMIYHQYRLKLPATVDPIQVRQSIEQAYPDATWRLRDYQNAAPRVERVIERLTLFLTLVGLTALLVGGVGVSNAVRAYLDGKLRTLAMLKCIGASNRVLFQTYLIQILVLAGGGILIGLLVGSIVPPLAARILEQLLPVPVQVGIYPAALLLAALFGLLITLSFAIWPLAQANQVPAAALFRVNLEGSRQRPAQPYIILTLLSVLVLATLTVLTAVHKGFALWFVAGALLTYLTFRAAAWLIMHLTRRLGRPRQPGLRLALTNLYRPGAPTPSVVLSLGLGLTVLVAIALIEGNMRQQIQDSIPEQAPAYFFIDIQSDQIDGFSALVNAIPGTHNLMKVPFLRGRITSIKGMEPEQALVKEEEAWMIRGDRGLTYATTAPENSTIIAGEWWPEDYAGPPLISIHKDLSEGFAVGLGDTLTLNILGREITATVANIRELDWQSMQLNFAIMLSPEPLRHAPHAFVATIAADTTEVENQIQREVTRTYPNITSVRIKDALNQVNDILGNISAAVRAIAAVTLLAGTLVLAGAIVAGHRRRVYDAVVLKVLGATRTDVLRAFLLEYGLLGLITSLIAAVVGTITAWAVLTWVMQQDWVFLPSTVLLTTLLCTAITLSLGFIGTWRALGQKAAPLLRNE